MQSHSSVPVLQDPSKDKQTTDEKKGTEAKPSAPQAELKPYFGIKMIRMKELENLEWIGSGGYGEVYKATWLKSPVAVKKLHAKTLSGDTEKDFDHETKMMMEAHYPHTVRLFGVCKDPGEYAMIMEYMTDGSLRKHLSDKKNLTWLDRYQIAFDIASGLSQIHSGFIIHRDLKSPNVLLYRDGKNLRAKISDFGFSTTKVDSGTSTKKKADVGTVRWRAPELFKKRGTPHTFHSDVYSLGMVIWELVTGELPYKDCDDDEARGWIKEGDKETIPATCPKELADLILYCWEDEPTKRPTAAEVAGKLEPMLNAVKNSVSTTKAMMKVNQTGLLMATLEQVKKLNEKAETIMDEQALIRATISAPPILSHVGDTPSPQPVATLLSLEETKSVATLPSLEETKPVATLLSLKETKSVATPPTPSPTKTRDETKDIAPEVKVKKSKKPIANSTISPVKAQMMLENNLDELLSHKVTEELLEEFIDILPENTDYDLSQINIMGSPLLSSLVLLEGDEEIILEMIEKVLEYKKINIDAPDGEGKTALHHAILESKRFLIKALIAAGADPRITYDYKVPFTYETTKKNGLAAWKLHMGASSHFHDITNLLETTITSLNNKDAAEAEAKEKERESQLSKLNQAPKTVLDEVNQKITFARLLPFLNPPSKYPKCIELTKEHFEGLEAHLPKDQIMNFDSFKINGMHPLIHLVTNCSEWYSTKMIEKLVEHKIDVNVTGDFGFTALHYAAMKKNAKLLLILLAAGADPRKMATCTAQFSHKDEELDVLGTWKAHDRENKYPAIIELLELIIKEMATGGVPLEKRQETVHYYKKHVELQDQLTPLITKCREEDTDEANRILPLGSKFNTDLIRHEGVPLLIALAEKYSWPANRIIKRLLELGFKFNFNAVNSLGQTALDITIKNNATYLMEILIKASTEASKKESKAPTEEKSDKAPAQGFINTFEVPLSKDLQFNLSLIKQAFPFKNAERIDSISAEQFIIWTKERKDYMSDSIAHLFDLKANKITASSPPIYKNRGVTPISMGLLASFRPLALLDPVTLKKLGSSKIYSPDVSPVSLGDNDYLVTDGSELCVMTACNINKGEEEFAIMKDCIRHRDLTISSITKLASGKITVIFKTLDSKFFIRLYEVDPKLKTLTAIHQINIADSWILDTIALANGNLLIRGCKTLTGMPDEHYFAIYDVDHGTCIRQISVPKLTDCHVLADGKTIVGVCSPDILYVYDTEYRLEKRYPVPNLQRLTVSPDGRLFLLTHDHILEYELPCMAEKLAKAKPSEEKSVASTPSVDSLAPTMEEKKRESIITTTKIGFFASSESKAVLNFKVFSEEKVSAIQSLSEDQLIFWTPVTPGPRSNYFKLNIFDIKTQKIIKTSPEEYDHKFPVTLTPSGYLVSRRQLELLDTDTLEVKDTLQKSNYAVPTITLPDNRAIVAYKNSIKLIDTSKLAKSIATKDLNTKNEILSIAPLSAGKFAATYLQGGDFVIQICEVKGQELDLLDTIKTTSYKFRNIIPLENDKLLIYALESKIHTWLFKIYDMHKREFIFQSLKMMDKLDCKILADGKTIVSARLPDSLYVFDTQTRTSERYIIDGIQGVAAHPDGRLLVIVKDQIREYELPCMKKEPAATPSL